MPTLGDVAARAGVSVSAVSRVLANHPAARVSEETRERIQQAARDLNYRPNFFARSLRSQRTFSIGVIIPELSDGYAALVLTGVEDYLLQAGYMYFVTSHRHKENLIDQYPRLLYERSVEGLIAIDTPYRQDLPLPVVNVSGHDELPGVTNIVLNHERAAELGLRHLTQLGHRRIAFIKGQSFSSDTEFRWQAIRTVSRQLGIETPVALIQQMEGDSASPEIGYEAAVRLLKQSERFTALFAFNDICAIGAIRAFREAGMQVPENVSVVGFDDIYEAAYHIPALTTIKQPLRRMGKLAAETLVKRICHRSEPYPASVQVEPELVIRESTAAVKLPLK